MTASLSLVLLLLAAAVAMFVRNRPRMDVVALLVIAVLPFTGVVTIGEAIAGFSNPNIVLVALLFVLGEGLVRTGVTRRLGDWISSKAGGSETRLMVLLMASVGVVGSMMSSTAIVAIFIPVVLRICQQGGIAASKLMMPLSVAALISGMMTLVATTPNLMVNAELVRQGKPAFDFFTITPFGISVLVLGILYMLVARRWLPDAAPGTLAERRRPSFRDWIERYELANREIRVRIKPGSPVLGQSMQRIDLRSAGVNLIAIERGAGRLLRPAPTTEFQAGDILLLDIIAPEVTITELAETYGVERLPLCPNHSYLTDRTQDLGMVEAIVPAESSLVGLTLLEARLRDDLGLTAIGLRRGSKVMGEDLLQQRLRVGDTLLLTGFWTEIQQLQRDFHDLVLLNLPVELDDVLPAHDRAPQALGILALVVVLLVTGLVPNVHAVLLGCLLMGAFKCIDVTSAYRAIHWQSLVLIVGMLPFALALERTGGMDLAAQTLLGAVGEQSPRMVLGTIFVLTAVIGMFISNTATAILMAPVAIAVAKYLEASPLPFAMMVALAASAAFMTPVSSPVNTLVVGPGNYRFTDFLRLGVPFALVVLVASVVLVPLLLPL
ncbi:SLC13 family permease [Thioalkalivibrio sp. XN279]|uniref:SLC13 family permease n=1 Tax=Thioalkalivibrio sp. XN279 TaxID=2714953 RepID=UPI0014085896|nr:SLC13 family permease [Thioalkalivibrio sp. XN279]NHA15069.1 SLC13 family permease [Thioalkalivibrio sp. XN279]